MVPMVVGTMGVPERAAKPEAGTRSGQRILRIASQVTGPLSRGGNFGAG